MFGFGLLSKALQRYTKYLEYVRNVGVFFSFYAFFLYNIPVAEVLYCPGVDIVFLRYNLLYPT